jgi:hypothetical protein
MRHADGLIAVPAIRPTAIVLEEEDPIAHVFVPGTGLDLGTYGRRSVELEVASGHGVPRSSSAGMERLRSEEADAPARR